MATFPTAEELQRPIPRIDGSIPTYQPAQTSDAGPRATAQAGQVIQSLGQDIGNFAERLDMADAQDAVNKFRQKRQELTLDPEKGFLRLKGKAALGKGPDGKSILDTTASALDAETEALAKSLSPRAAAAFRARAINETLGFKMDLVKHQISEGEKFEASVFNDTKAQLTDRAILSADDPKLFEERLSDLERSVDARAATLGVSAEAMKKGVVSDAVSFAIKQKIAKGDSSAIGFFDRYKDRLDPKDSLAITEAIDTMRRGVEALGFAHGGSDYDSRVAGHEGGAENGGMIFNKKGSGAFGPYQFMPKTWQSIRAANPNLNLPDDMTKATRAQHDAAHEAFKAGNAADLKAAGYEPTPANLYLAHRFGSGGAKSVLQANPSTPLDKVLPPEWAAQNPDMQGQTAGSFIDLAQRRMKGVAERPTAAPPPDNRVGDPLATQINSVTAGRAPPTLESAVDQATDPVVQRSIESTAQGIPNARQQLILIDRDREKKHAENYADLTAGRIDQKTYAARQAAVNTLHTQRTQKIELYKNEIWDEINTHMMKGGPGGTPAQTMPRADLISQIDPKDVVALQSMVDKNIAGVKPKTDWALYTEIERELTNPDQAVREAAAKRHPMQFRPHLADEQYNKILDLAAAINKGDPDGKVTHAQTVGRKITERLGEMGVKTGEKASVDDRTKERQFTEAVQTRLTELEKSKGGKKPLPEEIDTILNDMTHEVAGSGGWFSRNLGIGGRKRVWEMPAANPADVIVTMKNIAPSDVAKITTVLKARNIPVTEENIIRQYKLVRFPQGNQ